MDHLSGSTADNPYVYVGELGYYDHWQAPALADMLYLGMWFCDARGSATEASKIQH